ncbi:Serine/threonine-protein kinase ulk3 [Arthrobotrys conoides]|uniref:Serine/threonine-protein kinase ulk3 n=1 Tax=Arthrobotrys conoides TaxID=74498 RepID=A0AAN8NX99_9PEZI
MSTPKRLYQVLEGASKQVYPDNVVICLIPTTNFATEVMKHGNFTLFEFPVPADADEPDGPTIDITAMLLTLDSPPKIPGLGYTFGRTSKADVRIQLDGYKDFHFRIFFDSTTGILNFTDEAAPDGIYFRNLDTLTSGRNIKSLPLDSQFQIGEKGGELCFGGFIPGSDAHQRKRREYLASLSSYFLTIAHTLSPPNDCQTIKGYQNWGHLKKSQFQLYKLKTKTTFAGKLRWNLRSYHWNDKPQPPPDPDLQWEYETLRTLNHERIIRPEQFFTTSDLREGDGDALSVLVTEFCMHGDLSKHNLKKWPERRHLECIKQIAEGLDYIHARNIIHNAILYENILVFNLEPLHLKISGFSGSRVDARSFEPWIEKTMGDLINQTRKRHFRLDDEIGVVFERGSGNGFTNEMLLKVQRAFPTRKWKRDMINDAPEATDPFVTTAVDIWSLGLIHLRYYHDFEAICRECQSKFRPLYSELFKYSCRTPGKFGLLNRLPAHRPSASAVRDDFISLLNELQPESAENSSNLKWPSQRAISGPSIRDSLSPKPYSPGGSDPYNVLSPLSPNVPYNPDEWEGELTDDELKFRFQSPKQRDSPPASLLSRVASIIPHHSSSPEDRTDASQPSEEHIGIASTTKPGPILDNNPLETPRVGSPEPTEEHHSAEQPAEYYVEESTLEDSQLKRPFPGSSEDQKASKIQRPNSTDATP